MFNYEDILTRLKNGESEEDIAKEFTEALNKANVEKSKREAKEKAEKEKRKAGEEMIAAIFNYLRVAHPEIAADMDNVDVDSYLSILDSTITSLAKLRTFDYSSLFDEIKIPSSTSTAKVVANKKSVDDILNDWLKGL